MPKKGQNIVPIKVWGLLKVPKKVQKKGLLLIKLPKNFKKHFWKFRSYMPIDFPGSFVFIFLHREPSWEASLSAIMALWKDLHCISKTYKQQWALKTTCTCISSRLLFKCFFLSPSYIYINIYCVDLNSILQMSSV